MEGIEGKVGIITGAGRGIGEGCAAALAAAGASVLIADIEEARLAETVARIQAAGGTVRGQLCDVRDWASVEALAAACLEAYGRIDFLVANAGVANYSSIHDGDPEIWRRVIETNLLGLLFTVRACFPHMRERGAGHIVLMASIASRQTWVGEPAYIASKWGVAGFGWALRKEAIEHGVRVSMIEPGIVDTPLVRETEAGRDELARLASLSIEDVARTVVFALSQPEGVAISELMVTPVGPEL